MNFVLNILSRFQPAGNKIKAVDVIVDVDELRDGDILVSHSDLKWWNLLIPGRYTHAGLVVRKGDRVWVREAIPPTVTDTFIWDWISRYDEIVVLRPVGATPDVVVNSVDRMGTFLGRPYDFGFKPANGAYYCSEAVFEAYKHGFDSVGLVWGFKRFRRFWRLTVTPTDIVRADQWFSVIKIIGG